VTRLVLCAGLAGATLLVGLLTAIVQSHNRDLGFALDELREETTLVEAVNDASKARIVALDHGPLPSDAQKLDKPTKPLDDKLVSR
jgi:hypothetical protein